MANKKIQEIGLELGDVMRKIGRPVSQIMEARLFGAVAPALRELAMAMASGDVEQINDAINELQDAGREVEEICPLE